MTSLLWAQKKSHKKKIKACINMQGKKKKKKTLNFNMVLKIATAK